MRSYRLMIWARLKVFAKGFPKWFGLYLGLAGLITFNLFILEEAFQTTMFATWPAQDAQEWRLVKQSLSVMEKIRKTTVAVNYAAGWINPIAFVAYGKYIDSERAYIDGLTAKTLAHAPELFIGEKVTMTFIPMEKEHVGYHWILRNNRLTVWTPEERPVITGIMRKIDERLVLDGR